MSTQPQPTTLASHLHGLIDRVIAENTAMREAGRLLTRPDHQDRMANTSGRVLIHRDQKRQVYDAFWSEAVQSDPRVQAFEKLVEAARAASAHIVELRDAWERGALRSSDSKDPERSNRNVDVDVMLRDALAAAGGRHE